MRHDKYSLIEQLELNLKKSEGRERVLIIQLLGVLYAEKMDFIHKEGRGWFTICRDVYSGFIHEMDVKIYLDQIMIWENKLQEKDPFFAGSIILRAFKIFLYDEP